MSHISFACECICTVPMKYLKKDLSELQLPHPKLVVLPTDCFFVLLQLVSFVLIIVAAYSRVAAIITSISLVGSLIACGVFLFLIALVGLLGAAKHHQVLLFFVSLI